MKENIQKSIMSKENGEPMSKAASLAMELLKEKKRMQAEFDELQVQFEEVSSSTPTGGPDSYLKWIGFSCGRVWYIFTECRISILWSDLLYIRSNFLDRSRFLLER